VSGDDARLLETTFATPDDVMSDSEPSPTQASPEQRRTHS
jgi:hypothetical protein